MASFSVYISSNFIRIANNWGAERSWCWNNFIKCGNNQLWFEWQSKIFWPLLDIYKHRIKIDVGPVKVNWHYNYNQRKPFIIQMQSAKFNFRKNVKHGFWFLNYSMTERFKCENPKFRNSGINMANFLSSTHSPLSTSHTKKTAPWHLKHTMVISIALKCFVYNIQIWCANCVTTYFM